MKKQLIAFLLVTFLTGISINTYAWGRRGHKLVAEIAYKYMDENTRKHVQEYLGDMTPDEAGNWMDEEKSNTFYNYMRTWHYFDMEKGEEYKPTEERNILTVIHSALAELKNKEQVKKSIVKRDLLILFHLIGDLHQPLHTGYASDKGGNNVLITSSTVSGNLHSVWDSQIADLKDITLEECLKELDKYSPEQLEDMKKVRVLRWYYESRANLDDIYNFKDNVLDDAYINKSADLIKKQIAIAGIRLASILTEAFKDTKKTALSIPGRDNEEINFFMKTFGVLKDEKDFISFS